MKHKAPSMQLLAQMPALVALLTLTSPLLAWQDVGFEGPSFTGATANPTQSKPENKVWYHDGKWWAVLWSVRSGNGAFRIHRHEHLPGPPPTFWTDMAVLVDSRPNSRCDVLSDGTTLYIASHEFLEDGGLPSPNNLMVFSSYSYNGTTYVLNTGFPVTISNFSTEAMTIDKDTTGTIWAAWTAPMTGFTGERIWISHTTTSATLWVTPYNLPPNTTDLKDDDICGLTRFHDSGGPKIGVMWSDQAD